MRTWPLRTGTEQAATLVAALKRVRLGTRAVGRSRWRLQSASIDLQQAWISSSFGLISRSVQPRGEREVNPDEAAIVVRIFKSSQLVFPRKRSRSGSTEKESVGPGAQRGVPAPFTVTPGVALAS